MFEIRHYLTAAGQDVFKDWFLSLRDAKVRARIAARISRVVAGNFGDCKPVGNGVWELRINLGPGYRVYYGVTGKTCLMLLCGGDKRRQSDDINRAVEYWLDYRRREKKQ